MGVDEYAPFGDMIGVGYNPPNVPTLMAHLGAANVKEQVAYPTDFLLVWTDKVRVRGRGACSRVSVGSGLARRREPGHLAAGRAAGLPPHGLRNNTRLRKAGSHGCGTLVAPVRAP
jgi:hypothetical protein